MVSKFEPFFHIDGGLSFNNWKVFPCTITNILNYVPCKDSMKDFLGTLICFMHLRHHTIDDNANDVVGTSEGMLHT